MTGKVDVTIVDMAAVGAFGPDSRLVSFELEGLHTELNQFASCVLYGTATVEDRNGRRHGHRLVFKFKHPTLQLRDFYNNDRQFHNEILFYERIAPFLLASRASQRNVDATATPTFCRYFYGRNNCDEQAHRDVIVLENVSVHGYRAAVTSHRLALDFDHLVVALRSLAKAKYEDSVKFNETVANVKETQWSENGEWIFHVNVLRELFSVALDRLKERHVSAGDCGENEVEWISRFQSEILDDAMQSLRRMVVPVEPMAVLCHGDFNRNNLLFRYDDGGRPVDALAFDMATIRYGSPVLDLSFFLYLNADRQTLDEHWDELLDVYCAMLVAYSGDVPVPGRDQLNAEIGEYGFYGLVHVSYFVRIMLEEITEDMLFDDFYVADEFQMASMLLSRGGEPATEWVADALQHYIRCRYARAPASSTVANGDGIPNEI